MQDLYKILLSELPRIAKVVEAFPEGQRDKAFDMLVDALKTTGGIQTEVPEKVADVKNVLKNKIQAIQVEEKTTSVETEASKKLSKLRAKIFEKTTAASIEDTDDDPVKAELDELSTQDLSNIVFYQKGKTTPLSDML
ncbi:MAG: hypothetical protein M0D57_17170 [Sphingobacteriales bacterium JAD_PAG50586_3]|nr:MAG: hypothetical protein M0D57_17170 [Sphingobacteriales bacterium JAD_PAG50586_3]